MRQFVLPAVAAVLIAVSPALAAEGLVTKPSDFGVAQTMNRLEAALRARGVTVFARIDHAAGAAKIGQPLPPIQLLVFGSPAMGTPLMQSRRTVGIDLPLKALVWRTPAGQVMLAYNDPAFLARRHGVQDRDPVFAKMGKVLDAITDAATKR